MFYDEGIWSYIGIVWNRYGVAPYTGIVENKTPGEFYLYFFKKELFKNKFFISILIWFAIDSLYVISSGYMYGHQIKQLLPSLSLIIGISIGNIYTLINKHTNMQSLKHILIGIIAVLTLCFFPYISSNNIFKYTLLKNNIDSLQYVETWIKENSNEEDFIYVISERSTPIPVVSAYSERLAPSKYFFNVFINSDKVREILYNDILTNPPFMFVIVSTMSNILSIYGENIVNYINNNYFLFEKKVNCNIFKKKWIISEGKLY